MCRGRQEAGRRQVAQMRGVPRPPRRSRGLRCPPQPRKDAARDAEPEPDMVMALVNINNSVASLARAVTVSNIHLATIARYVEVLAGKGSDDSDEESGELESGDEDVVRGLDMVNVNTWLDQDW